MKLVSGISQLLYMWTSSISVSCGRMWTGGGGVKNEVTKLRVIDYLKSMIPA